MVDQITDGIVEALHGAFGESYEIYTEAVAQGLKEPCFSVMCLNPTNDQFLGTRYFRRNQFCIHFFPASKTDAYAEINAARERLFGCLEYITVNGDLVRGTQMNNETVGGILHFFINFDMFTVRETEKVPMQEVEQNILVEE